MDYSESDSPDSISSSDSEQPVALPIVCRVKPTLWWLLGLAACGGVFFFAAPFLLWIDIQNRPSTLNSSPQQNFWGMVFAICLTWSIATVIGWFVLSTALEVKRGEIRADAMGLRWKGAFGGWKSARWNEITDFYQKSSHSEDSREVETPAGTLILSSNYEGIDRIAALVVQKASQTGNRGWELKGQRSKAEWSRTFPVWSNEQKWTAPCITGLMLLQIPVVWSMVAEPRKAYVSLGFWMDAFALVIFGGLALSFIAMCIWMPISLWRERKFAWNHRDEKLVLNAQGLEFTSNTQNLTVKWDEVRSVNFLSPEKGIKPVQIETTQGNFILWSGSGGTWTQVRSTFEQYAPKVLEPHNKNARETSSLKIDLEGTQGAWSGGEAGVGARRWGYRLRWTRFTFQCATFLLPIALFIYYFISSNVSPDPEVTPTVSWPLFAGLCLLCGFTIVLGWLWYHRAEILADENGLEFRSPFHRPHRASWQEITGLGTDAWGEFARAGHRKIYFVRFFAPVRVEELRAYIEERIAK